MTLRTGLFRSGLVVLIGAVAVVAGCGPARTPTIPVTGKVTYKGQAVEGATVSFFKDGTGTPAVGTTGADGSFSLSRHDTNDGAEEGTHKVTVTKIESTAAAVPAGESMEAAAAR